MRSDRPSRGAIGRTSIERLKEFLVSSLYAVIVFLLFLPAKVLFRLRVRGKGEIDPDEGYIVIARHRSYWDIPMLAMALGWRNRIHFIARKGLQKKPLFRPLLKLFTTVIDRDNFSKTDFRSILESFRRERLIGIFPEGTTKDVADTKAGAIHFARLTNKKLLPVNIAIRGPYPPRYPFAFPRMTISIGKAFSLSELEADLVCADGRAGQNRLLSTRLMERVDALEWAKEEITEIHA